MPCCRLEIDPAFGMADTPPIPTLEFLPDRGVTHIRVWCGRWPHGCTHQGLVSIKGIDLRQTIVEFAAKLRCEVCGTLGGQAMPDWPTVPGQSVSASELYQRNAASLRRTFGEG